MPTYTFSTLNDPLATAGTFATGINDTGQVVGYYNNNGNFHGFLYSGGSCYTTLDEPLGISTLLTGVNTSGEIVGFYSDNTGIEHGFRYSGGSYTTLDDPSPGVIGTRAYAINASGEIVGFYGDNTGIEHGFRYSGGSYTTLADPLATTATVALGINDEGQIVGNYSNGIYSYGFLYSGGSYTTLNDPLGTTTFAEGINEGPNRRGLRRQQWPPARLPR